MGKKKTKKKRAIRWWYVGVIIVIAAILILALKIADNKNRMDNDSLQSNEQISIEVAENMQPIPLGKDIEIMDIGKYTGVYMEDGTDDVVADVLMAVVKNNGSQTLQYGEIYMDYGESEAAFSLSTLLPGASVVVLEQNRMSSQDKQPDSVRMENFVFFQEDISMHEDLFEVTAMDGMMNVKNISGRDISGDIFIYYKNSSSDMYYGGITYRARVENGLADGELKQIAAAHYSTKGSTLMMVTYSE